MKRLLLLIIFVPLLLAAGGLAGRAAFATEVLSPVCDNIPPGGEKPSICKDDQTNAPDSDNPLFGPNGIITTGVQILTIVVGVIVVFVIIISGVRFVTSQGDPNSVSQARNGLLYGIIGLIIAASAQLVVSFILSKL